MGLDVRIDEIDALAIGERGVTRQELTALDEHGYVVVPALLTTNEVQELCAEFERLVAEDPNAAAHELGTRRSKARSDNETMAVCWRHRVVLDAACHLLGPAFQVGHVDLRDPSPGYGHQQQHPDHGPVRVLGLTATWFLDDFTADNGATRMLDASHRLMSPPPLAPAGSLSGEVVATGPAGSVLLRDARLYHAAGRNGTSRQRRSALVFYQHRIPEPLY